MNDVNEQLKTVCIRIKFHRFLCSMKIEEVAKLAECSPALICRIENQQRLPGIKQLIKLATVFGINPGVFFQEIPYEALKTME